MLTPVITRLATGALADYMTLRDATGSYNVDTNPGGYGLPNMVAPPQKIGITWRNWADTDPYASLVSADGTLIAELLGSTGHKFLASDIGISSFSEGIQHIKYYPFVQAPGTDVYTWDETTKTFTRATGSYDLRSTYLSNPAGPFYVALALNSDTDAVISPIMYLGDPADWTENTFTVTNNWVNTGSTNMHIMFATVADLKTLITENTKACIAKKVGKLAKMDCCDRKVIDKLTDLTMWVFAADVKLQCLDYEGANDLINAALKECTYCISEDCQTCRT